MSYHATDLMGESIDEPDESQIRALVQSLSQADDEHPDVSLNHESGWSLSAFRDGLVIWENVEDEDADEPGELEGLSQDEIVQLFLRLARGDIAGINELAWQRDQPGTSQRSPVRWNSVPPHRSSSAVQATLTDSRPTAAR
ncbi:putative hypothetical protein [Streptomyces sp. NBRC 110611]|uniref:hypothetical protein n=1 Tax=Streptomyces sp. NBRC 110611 TaxID=1621259 RepID=UPI00082DFD40|nr:hypothetical protein [Streptomyces sp. NBRC 110611]GAU65972.1 putative hypothetical protein [Streptomyces sp. NBRC 110611]